jgi:hypothetical protein
MFRRDRRSAERGLGKLDKLFIFIYLILSILGVNKMNKKANPSPVTNMQLAADMAETKEPVIGFVNEHPDHRGLVKQGVKKPVRHAPSFGG